MKSFSLIGAFLEKLFKKQRVSLLSKHPVLHGALEFKQNGTGLTFSACCGKSGLRKHVLNSNRILTS